MARATVAYDKLSAHDLATDSRPGSRQETSCCEIEDSTCGRDQSTGSGIWPLELSSRACSIFLLALLIFAATCVGSFIGNVWSISAIRKFGQPVGLGTCGSTPEEARKNGCIYDVIQIGFMHPQCFDEDLHTRYMKEHNFTFYGDKDGLVVLPIEEVISGQIVDLWTDGGFHLTHCAYMWEKHWRALKNGGVNIAMDARTRDEAHVQHCINWVANPNVTDIQGPRASWTRQRLGIVDCLIGPV
ncbi:hypothetical protein CI238_11649 [Colletotrichum incanum]|uniref:Uncharacterized protein n=1 Tax=Colletotrichum incanum TaxID=1573173 RepID=A0A167BCQ8_COLIC|nr:hypothetical protein CI238_11649 [Colletotrichum incanum]